MNKLQALWGLFRKGQVVADPQLWKNRQIKATVLAGVILAVINLASAFGYAIPIDANTANAIAAGIIAVVNTVLTITTSDKVGFSESTSDKAGLPSKEGPDKEVVTLNETTSDMDTPIYFK